MPLMPWATHVLQLPRLVSTHVGMGPHVREDVKYDIHIKHKILQARTFSRVSRLTGSTNHAYIPKNNCLESYFYASNLVSNNVVAHLKSKLTFSNNSLRNWLKGICPN